MKRGAAGVLQGNYCVVTVGHNAGFCAIRGAKIMLSTLLLMAIVMAAYAQQEPEYHRDLKTLEVNKLPPRTEFIEKENSPYYIKLNGEWDFGFEGRWYRINVPGNWEVQGFGVPIYVNQRYEFNTEKPTPPFLPDSIPMGLYKRTFTIPDQWRTRNTYLSVEGAKSGCYVYVNGQFVGYNEDSKNTAEYLITPYLRDGENTLELKIYRWSTGSYLECQDFWRISGIERDVAIYSEPTITIRDFAVRSTLADDYTTGRFRLSVDVTNTEKKQARCRLQYVLRDHAGEVLAKDEMAFKVHTGGWTTNVFDEKSVAAIQPWSAEQPNLYYLTITLLRGKRAVHTVSYNVGFRRVEINGSLLTINGKPVKIKGVNIHEHNPATGHYVTEDLMRKDFELMKQNNINAVRLSHYPQSRRFYELCDEYGIYVYDEANVESHGMGYNLRKGATLGNNPDWWAAHTTRTMNMFERNKNHPCVTFWSLGNEAGNGYNFYSTYLYLKSADQPLMQRPVSYERALLEWNTDMYVPMYVWADWLERTGRAGSDRPVMACEYSHAMGNSNGNITGMWKAINRYPNLAGGFIWDWIDQGLDATTEDGQHFWTYGGDYGSNMPSDGNFNCNGLLNPDRSPHPAISEVKYAYQNVEIKPLDQRRQCFRITNRHSFTNLDKYNVEYDFWLVADTVRSRLASGLRQISVPPLDYVDIELPYTVPILDREYSVELNFAVTTRQSQPGLPQGAVVATEQYVEFYEGSRAALEADWLPFAIKGDKAEAQSEDGSVKVVFDKSKGCITSYIIKGVEYVYEGFGLQPNFWRAPTDNDYGNGMPKRCQMWKEASIHHQVKAISTPEESTLSIVYSLPAGNEYVATYRISDEGLLHADIIYTPASTDSPEVPRIGMRLRLPGEYDRVSYQGRGPEENYIDRNHGTPQGLYHTSVDELYFPYVRPQENGHHTEVRLLKVYNSAGRGITVRANRFFEFNALHNSVEDFDAEEARNRPYQWRNFTADETVSHDEAGASNVLRRQTHINDIIPRPYTEVCIDHMMMGVGGNDSWGSKPDEPFIIKPDKQYRWSFTVQPAK